jgi:hypothetical protein
VTTPVFPSSTNLFIPSATGQVIGYLRKPGRFKLFEYAQIVKSSGTDKKGWPVCLFTTIDPDAPIRVVTDQEYAWEDGDDPPEGAGMLINFTTTEVRMFRRAYPYRLGEQMVETAELFPVLPVNRQIALMLAMTNKTARIWSLLDSAANWGTNTADANALNGGKGKWSTASATEGSPYYLAIKRSLTAATQTINLATNSVVQPEDLKLVISPLLAEAGANSGEITDYLKGSPFAKMQQEGKERGRNQQYGFPDYYAGVEVVIEDASRSTDRPSATGVVSTTNRNYIKSPSTACLLSRIGGLDGVEGAPAFSTLQIYYYKYEMAVEEKHDVWKKRWDGRVIDQFKEVLASNRSGYLITNCQ